MAILVDDITRNIQPTPWEDFLHRLARQLRIAARLSRRARAHRAAMRLITTEIRDPRLLDDMGVDTDVSESHRATRALARAMGGF